MAFQRPASAALASPFEAAMEPYIHNEDRHKTLLTLLADKIAKEKRKPCG